jgi:nucleotide-binding universal stress UspA family protein
MTQRWVVGVDGSEGARVALEWAALQAAGRDVELRAVWTWRVPSFVPDSMRGVGMFVDWDKVVEDMRERLAAMIDAVPHEGVTITPDVVQGRAATVLVEMGDAAELLVVGSRGHGGLRGATLGSVSRQCATHSAVPVVVVPEGVEATRAERVVVGFDGSANASAAVRWALGFAAPDADVLVLRAVDPWTDATAAHHHFPGESDETEAAFEDAMSELDPERRAQRAFAMQDPRQALLDAGAQADLVVLGARGAGVFRAMLLGSTSTWMLHQTTCPVAIVPGEPPHGTP